MASASSTGLLRRAMVIFPLTAGFTAILILLWVASARTTSVTSAFMYSRVTRACGDCLAAAGGGSLGLSARAGTLVIPIAAAAPSIRIERMFIMSYLGKGLGSRV